MKRTLSSTIPRDAHDRHHCLHGILKGSLFPKVPQIIRERIGVVVALMKSPPVE